MFKRISNIYSCCRHGLVVVADFSITLDRLLKEEPPARGRPYQLQAVDRVWIRHDGGSAPQRVQRNDLLFEDVLPNVQERFSLKRSRSAARAWQSIFPSVKMGRSMSARSHLELQQLKLCEVDGAVRRFVEQPIRIVYTDGEGKLRSHTPDLFVERETHSEFIEVKWERDARASKNEARWPFIASAISALGYAYAVVTERHLMHQPLTANVDRLLRHQHSPQLSRTASAMVWDVLATGPQTLANILASQAEPSEPSVLRALADGWLCTDLTRPISRHSVVRLSKHGGNRK